MFKVKHSRSLFVVLSLLAAVAVACGGSTGGGATDQAANLAATQESLAATQQAILDQSQEEVGGGEDEAPAGGGQSSASEDQPYFTEEFTTAPQNWTYYLYSGEDNDFDVYTENDRLVFDLQGEYIWAYLLYDSYTYTDVRVDFTAENLGSNNNNVSLICRYNDRGWYEFNVANNGLYWIYRYTVSDDTFHELYSGGVANLRTGKDTNEYTAICEGDELTLGANGTEVRTVRDSTFDEGQVGVGISSFEFTPVMVEFDYVQISEP